MWPRFVGRLGLADAVTVSNAALGFVAVAAATIDPELAARVVLLGGILDALDGIAARRWGGTTVGPHLDSLADVATFGVAPAFVVFSAGRGGGHVEGSALLWIAVPALYVATTVVRLGLYTTLDVDDRETEGVQSTLAATLVTAGLLAGVGPIPLLAGTALLSLAMLAPIPYPDLRVRDAVSMGIVQALAVLAPTAWDRVFPTVLLVWALGYLAFAPRYYPRSEGKRS
ncbi:MAG: protein sorting system archaetidylserine synthase [Halanaeroarchaeum sp.]